MNNVTAKMAAKMMALVDKSTYQGRITRLAIAFLYHTRVGFSELARLKVRDVYQLGVVRISVHITNGSSERIVPLNDRARQIVGEILEAQSCQGLQPFGWCPLFRTPTGGPFDCDQLARVFWLYHEAIQMIDAS